MDQPRIHVGHIVTVVEQGVCSFALDRHAPPSWFAANAMLAKRIWFSSDFEEEFEMRVDVVKGGPDHLTIGGDALGERILIYFGCGRNYVLRGDVASKQLITTLPVTKMAEYSVRDSPRDLLACWTWRMSTNLSGHATITLETLPGVVGCKSAKVAVQPVEMHRSGEDQFILVAEVVRLVAEVVRDILQGRKKPGRVVIQVDTKSGISLAYCLAPE